MRLAVFTDLGVWQPWGGRAPSRRRDAVGDRSQAGGGEQDACPGTQALISERTYPHWSWSGWVCDHQHRFETVLVWGVREQTLGRLGGRTHQANVLTAASP